MMALRRQRQEDPVELEVTLVYRANFRPVTGYTVRPYSKG